MDGYILITSRDTRLIDRSNTNIFIFQLIPSYTESNTHNLYLIKVSKAHSRIYISDKQEQSNDETTGLARMIFLVSFN